MRGSLDNASLKRATPVLSRHDKPRFVRLDGPTRGAAETAAHGLRALPPAALGRPTVLLDGDTVYSHDVLGAFRAQNALNAVFVFADDRREAVYSYVRLAGDSEAPHRACAEEEEGNEAETETDNEVGGLSLVERAWHEGLREAEATVAGSPQSPPLAVRGNPLFADSRDADAEASEVGEKGLCDGGASNRPTLRSIDAIQEKDKRGMSPLACSGCYCFASGARLLAAVGAVTASGAMQRNQEGTGELYTSGVIAHMLAVGEHFVALELTPSGQEESGVPPFAVLGTPQQLREHLRAVPCAPHRFCFDLDGTLVSAPRVPGDYSTCEPIAAMVEHARKLHAAGHTIIVHTARRMRTHRGNVGGVIADIGAVTIAQLKAFGVPFDELVFGKPYAHFYIDDRAISPFLDIEQETGVLADVPCVEIESNGEATVTGGAAAAVITGDKSGASLLRSRARVALAALALVVYGGALLVPSADPRATASTSFSAVANFWAGAMLGGAVASGGTLVLLAL